MQPRKTMTKETKAKKTKKAKKANCDSENILFELMISYDLLWSYDLLDRKSVV